MKQLECFDLYSEYYAKNLSFSLIRAVLSLNNAKTC